MIQEPARASEAAHIVPCEPVTAGVAQTHVLTRAYCDIMDQVKAVGVGDVTRGGGEDVAVIRDCRGGSSHGGADHLQKYRKSSSGLR